MIIGLTQVARQPLETNIDLVWRLCILVGMLQEHGHMQYTKHWHKGVLK